MRRRVNVIRYLNKKVKKRKEKTDYIGTVVFTV